jgi:hypothetical protein
MAEFFFLSRQWSINLKDAPSLLMVYRSNVDINVRYVRHIPLRIREQPNHRTDRSGDCTASHRARPASGAAHPQCRRPQREGHQG